MKLSLQFIENSVNFVSKLNATNMPTPLYLNQLPHSERIPQLWISLSTAIIEESFLLPLI